MLHDWNRFWQPFGVEANLGDDGYLHDPNGEYGSILNPHVVETSHLVHRPCLAFLGEQGIGKSTALRSAFDQPEAADRRPTDGSSPLQTLSLDFGSFGSETSIAQALFDAEPFHAWIRGDWHLTLVLDGLDECRLQIPNLVKFLLRGFRQVSPHLERLVVRVGCRTVDWPTPLRDGLIELWKVKEPFEFELLPLRRSDVALAARDRGADVDEFLAAVADVDAQPLARTPVTLNMLLDLWEKERRLPETRQQLYDLGCRRLCEETPDRQHRPEAQGVASRRLPVAKRLAAASVFCNKTVIDRSVAPALSASEIASPADFVVASGERSEWLTEEAVLDCLRSALFRGSGPGRLTFAHRTYADFLAASYLHQTKLDLRRKLDLLQHPEATDGRVVPQLAGAVAWLCEMDDGVFRTIAACDPQILLQSDLGRRSDSERAQIVEGLLEKAKAESLDRSDWRERARYRHLRHPHLACQLAARIGDKSIAVTARSFALDIGHDCELSDLQDLVAEIAIDESENRSLRLSATYFVSRFGDEATRRRLVPLALARSTSELTSDLKAAALEGVWPSILSATELFASLPLVERQSGSYAYFLSHELLQGLAEADLPIAIRWAADLESLASRLPLVDSLYEQIAARAWRNLDREDVFEAYVRLARHRIDEHHRVIPSDVAPLGLDNPLRRQLVDRLISESSDSRRSTALGVLQLVDSTDFVWAIERAAAAENEDAAKAWAELAGWIFDARVPNAVEAIAALREYSRTVASQLGPLVDPIDLDSDLADRLRQQLADRMKWEQEAEEGKNPPPVDPPPPVRVEEALQASEAGNAEAWWVAARELELEPHDQFYERELEPDVTSLPGWLNAAPGIRERLLAAAERYLEATDGCGVDWLGGRSTPGAAIWGYKAILLLRKECKNRFDALTSDAWSKWAASVVDHHSTSTANAQLAALDEDIAKTCLELAPDAVAACLVTYCRNSDGAERAYIEPAFLGRCWNAITERALCSVLEEGTVSGDAAGRILNSLIERGSLAGRCIAATRVAESATTEGDATRVAAAASLLRAADEEAWSIVWPYVAADSDFGRQVLPRVAMHGPSNSTLALRLDEDHVADLYIFLERHFSHESDGDRSGFRFVGPNDAVREYRDATLRVLTNRGTPASVAALERIALEFPNLDWLRRVVFSARSAMLRETWTPIRPAELVELANSSATRLVQSERQLQQVILESLEALQQELQGETPAAPDLWDEVAKGRFRPKDENHFSDYVKRHLQRDLSQRGIVSLREVEIRRGEGAAAGERTDIHVTGILPELDGCGRRLVRVIIEAKGCWHRELETALVSQLAGRYLCDNECRHGIYLVGWFACPQWDESDLRAQVTARRDPEVYLTSLKKQAASLRPTEVTIEPLILRAGLR